MIRASTVIAASMALLVWGVSPSWGAECPIGPLTVSAPTCNVAQGEHPEGKMDYLEWKEGEISRAVTVIAVNRSQNFKNYMTRWQHSHKCAVKALPLTHPVQMGTQTPPQIAFKGVCAGGENFILQAIRLKNVWVEVQVFRSIPNDPTPESFIALLDAIHLPEQK
jgi:hypothetical protein